MVKTLDKFSLFGSAGNGKIERRLQDQFGLLERIALTKVPQELKEPNVPWQVALTETPKHVQVGLQQGEETLRAILVDVTTGIFLLRMIHVRMHVARHRPIAARGVRIGPPGANISKFTVSSNECVINTFEQGKTRGERAQRRGDVPPEADPLWRWLAYPLVLESSTVWET